MVLSSPSDDQGNAHALRFVLSQVPEQVFVTDKLPKTATGKIQRRMMVEAFIKKSGAGAKQQEDAALKARPLNHAPGYRTS